MSWKPIVAGVDESTEGAWAATVAWNIAQLASTRCHLIHAAREVAELPTWVEPQVDREEMVENLTRATKERVERSLSGEVPFEALASLEVRLGRPKYVLPRAIADHGAGLLVLGGKHHSALSRWFGGSTAVHTVQTVDVPTLIAIPFEKSIERVLVAVDMSDAAGPTIAEALSLAAFLNASVKVIHVIEPMPDIPSYPMEIESEYHFAMGRELFEEFVSPLIGGDAIERETLFGPAEPVIAEHVQEWKADVLVIGSHGKGWVERLVLGSTTRRLINDLPASLLVVPVPEPE
jgi:nucleotide-binding universal stress UspA family protein